MPGPHPLVDRINLGGGIQQSDLPMLAENLGHLFTRLASWPPGSVDIWLRVKDRDGAGMKTTIEVQVPSLPMLVASSKRAPLGAALDRAADKLVRKINDSVEKYADHGRASIRK
jgi:ribosome-associated translation inhibitor RaiA